MKKGFTIIELVISIFVLAIAVVGIFSALSIIMILTADSADRFTATYLAQEGMEIVRNIRDTNWLNMNVPPVSGTAYSWADGLTNDATQNSIDCTENNPSWCEADYAAVSLSHGKDPLELNSNGFYVYNTKDINPVETKFKRRIIIEPIVDVDGNSSPYHILKAKIEVSWKRKATILDAGASADECGKNNCITTIGTLYNWYTAFVAVKSVKIIDNNPAGKNYGTLHYNNNETAQLTVDVEPTYATIKDVVWSSDKACATVDSTGLVTAVSSCLGDTVTISVTSASNSNIHDEDTFTIVNR